MYSRHDLPELGVIWHDFSSLEMAEDFALWAEAETCNDVHPCETEITMRDGIFFVKVRNW